MKVSVVVPVLNEETGIKRVLNSLLLQSLKPAEILVADAGSTDNTLDVIDSFQNKGVPIKIVHNKEKLPGAGRNVAIKNASYDLIACIDAGNAAEPDWLQELVAPIINDNSIDVVYGKFLPSPQTPFENSVVAINYTYLAPYFFATDNGGLVEDMQKKGIPFTGSSLLFKKSAWERAKGFPSWLRTGEDKLFGKNLSNSGCKIFYNPRAIILHHIRENTYQMFRQGYTYERGNGYTRQTSSGVYHILSKYVAGLATLILSLFYPALLLILLLGVPFYSYRFGYAHYIRYYKKLPGLREFFSIPLALFARDAGLILGIFVGHLSYYRNPEYKEKLTAYKIVKGS